MEKKTFDFDVEINGEKFTIKPVVSGIEYAVLHEVWRENKLLYILQPGLNAHGIPSWKLTDEYNGLLIDKPFITLIGEAIERHGS